MIFFFVCTKCTKLRICFSYFENTILRGKNTIFKLYSYNEQSYLGNSDLIPTLFCMKGYALELNELNRLSKKNKETNGFYL